MQGDFGGYRPIFEPRSSSWIVRGDLNGDGTGDLVDDFDDAGD